MAAVAPHDPANAVKEMERAVKKLGFKAVIVNSHIQGHYLDEPQFLLSSPGPQPGGLAYWSANKPRDPARSWQLIVDGKYSLGPVNLYSCFPAAVQLASSPARAG